MFGSGLADSSRIAPPFKPFPPSLFPGALPRHGHRLGIEGLGFRSRAFHGRPWVLMGGEYLSLEPGLGSHLGSVC